MSTGHPGTAGPVHRCAQELRRQGRRRARAQPRCRDRRIPDAARAVGLGQDHDADHAGGLRAADGGSHHRRRRGYHRRAGREARHRHGVPELRAVSQHDGGREHRLSAQGARLRGVRRSRAGETRAVDGAARRPRRPPPAAAFRRPAAARRGGPRAGVRAAARAARRAAGRARPATARADAVRAEAPACSGWASPWSMSRTTRSRR